MLIRALHLARQLAAEREDAQRLQRLQLAKLRTLVNESYEHTEAYRCLMQRAGVCPDDIETLQDIERLPIVRKADLLEFSELERSHVQRRSQPRTVRIATSGSSGAPFEFLVDSGGNAWRKAQYLRPYVTNGRRPWHRVLRFTAVALSGASTASAFNPFRERRIACTAPLDEQLNALQVFRPAVVQGYPSALRCLAFELLRRELSTPHVELVFTDSELLTRDARSLIERAFDAPVIDVFGAYETDNIAYQCSRDSNYHFAADSGILEIARNGAAVADGDGELIVTVLNNLTTPFIRYNLQDVVGFAPESCDCGRTFPLIRIRAGRSDDLVVGLDGTSRSPMSFLWRFDAFSELFREYQIEQTAIDRFVARVVTERPLTAAEEDRVRAAIGADYPNAEVIVAPLPRLERTPAGKLKAFVCAVPPRVGGPYGD